MKMKSIAIGWILIWLLALAWIGYEGQKEKINSVDAAAVLIVLLGIVAALLIGVNTILNWLTK